MNKLQAAMRDKSAKTWKDRTIMYKVGSIMKGCRFCEGFNIFRAYKPWVTRWTWACTDCGSKDLRCWAPDMLGLVEEQLGKEPRILTRTDKEEWLKQVRKERTQSMRRTGEILEEFKDKRREQVIKELQQEVERIKIMLNGGKVL